jgi:Glycosyl transferase family 2
MPTTLTIGIPTYQRREAVVTTVSALLKKTLPGNVEILVVDDGSRDGTAAALDQLSAGPLLRVVRNDVNRGFVGAFARLFEKSDSKYLFVTSDEDEVSVEHLDELLAVCTSSDPLIVSPQAIIDGRVFRGRATRRAIRPAEWRSASNYISGVTFNVPVSRPLLDPITQKASENGAAEVYPQVLLAADLLAQGEGLWLDLPLTVKREQLQSHISDKKHGTYYYLPGRWAQYQQFEAHLSNLAEQSPSGAQAERAREMLAAQEPGLYGTLREAIRQERPDLIPAFDAGARRASRLRILQRSFETISDPRRAASAIRERIAMKRSNRARTSDRAGRPKPQESDGA